jgi:hypothetical protein
MFFGQIFIEARLICLGRQADSDLIQEPGFHGEPGDGLIEHMNTHAGYSITNPTSTPSNSH